MDNTRTNPLAHVATIILLLLSVWVGYLISRDVQSAETTGVISVTTSKPGAVITVSGAKTQAAVAGYGSLKIRVPAGDYLVSATVPGAQTSAVTQVSTKQTTEISLDLSQTTALPTTNDIDYQNFEELVTNGLSTSQVGSVKLALFDFKKAADTITLIPGTIYTAPLNPNSNDSSFGLSFKLKVDDAQYVATVRYSFGAKVQLTITQGDKTVFSKSVDATKLYEQPSVDPERYDSTYFTETL